MTRRTLSVWWAALALGLGLAAVLRARGQPHLALPLPPPRHLYISATSYDMIESDFAQELDYVPAPGQLAVTVGWTPPPGPAPRGYRVYWGFASRAYTNSADAGGLTIFTIQFALPPPPQPTNYVYAFAQTSTSPVGPFQDAAVAPVVRLTNAVAAGTNLLWRLRVVGMTNALP